MVKALYLTGAPSTASSLNQKGVKTQKIIMGRLAGQGVLIHKKEESL